jgi:hypothetical protein
MSFIGLVAATAAEMTSRIPGTEDVFGLVVAGTSALIMGVGAILMGRYMPRLFGRISKRSAQAAGYSNRSIN